MPTTESKSARRAEPRPVRPPIWLWIAAIVSASLAWAAFAPALHAEFVRYDDYDLLVENPAFRASGGPSLRYMFSATMLGHWDPLTWLSWALDQALFGLAAGAFHRTNLVLHALNAALFCVLAFRVLSIAQPRFSASHPNVTAVAALCAALLFAVHPLRAETVAWVTERRGLLVAFFLLLALLAYLRAFAPERVATVSKGWYAASVLFLILAQMSKGLAMTFVALVLVLDVYPLRRLPVLGPSGRRWWGGEARTVWLQKIPYLVLAVAGVAVSHWAVRSIPPNIESLEKWGLWPRIGQAFFGLVFYVRKTLLPRDLAVLIELPYRFDPLEPRFLGSAVAVLVAAGAIFLMRRKAPALAAAAAIYAISIAPVLGLAQAGPQLAADRYSYFACLPWALLAGGALLLAWRRFENPVPRAVSIVVLAALLAVLFTASRAQTEVWRDSRSLWTHAVAVGQGSSIAHVNLGGLEATAGNERAAAEHFEAALRVRPDQGQAWFNLAILHVRAGRFAEAERAGLEACEHMVPTYIPLVNLGYLYLDFMGRPDEAVECFRRAVADVESLATDMFSPVPYQALAAALERRGETAESRLLLEKAARGLQALEGSSAPPR